MTDRLVALVKPFQFKTSWVVTLPKDILREIGCEESMKKGIKVAVYWNEEERRFEYQFPKSSESGQS